MIITNNEEDKDVIQLEDQGKSLPLVALYKKRTAAHFFSLLNQGERRLRVAVNGLNIKTIAVTKTQQKAVRNINTLSDLNSIEDGIKH